MLYFRSALVLKNFFFFFTDSNMLSIFVLLGDPEPELDKPSLARFKNWGAKRCFGKRVRGVCVLGIGDLHYLFQGPELFANKFHADFEPLAFDCLEELIFNRTALAPKLQHTFDVGRWSKLPFVKNSIK